MKIIIAYLSLVVLISCTDAPAPPEPRKASFPKYLEQVTELPRKDNLWVFILAGQSNMAGRGLVEPNDTIPSKRILSINESSQLIYAKEPLHFYEPNLQGLDCGLSFANTLISRIPDSISILVLPTAVGGSSVEQWLDDASHRGVNLLSNFRAKAKLGAAHGDIKAILWHQGESNAQPEKLVTYPSKLSSLFDVFRSELANDSLPILLGELPAFPKNYENRQAVNVIMRDYVARDPNSGIIYTQDLMHKGDSTHFDAAGQRTMGERFGEAYLETIEQ